MRASGEAFGCSAWRGPAHGRTSRRYGIRPTWPTFNRLFFTPLDHILATDNLVVTDFRTGPAIGSDHLPVQATIAVGE